MQLAATRRWESPLQLASGMPAAHVTLCSWQLPGDRTAPSSRRVAYQLPMSRMRMLSKAFTTNSCER